MKVVHNLDRAATRAAQMRNSAVDHDQLAAGVIRDALVMDPAQLERFAPLADLTPAAAGRVVNALRTFILDRG